MRGSLLLKTETIALIVSILLIGGAVFLFGSKAIRSDDSPIREEADVLSCSEKDARMVSSRSNGTHFTAYLESSGGFRLEVSGKGNATRKVEASNRVQEVTVPVSQVLDVKAVFPGCDREIDLR